MAPKVISTTGVVDAEGWADFSWRLSTDRPIVTAVGIPLTPSQMKKVRPGAGGKITSGASFRVLN